MLSRWLLVLLFPVLSFAQDFTSGPLVATTSGPYDISGDSTLTVNVKFKGDHTERKIGGFFEVWTIIDSLNGDGAFASSDTSNLKLVPRLRTGYDTADDAKDLTWYNAATDFDWAFQDTTLTVGAYNFDFALPECDAVQIQHDFGGGDTLRIFYVFKYSGKK